MSELEAVSGVYLLSPADFKLYPVATVYDPLRDELGHIPYTPLFFAALGTLLARKVHVLLSPARKVVVLDCDNTLWRGVVGEEGINGITVPPQYQALQQFMAALSHRGFLLCLCSKNNESDVLEVFDRRPDMVLKRSDFVAWQINWQSKSESIRTLARDLNLGLDSFVFLDDSPVECAEMRANCPEVLTLRLPTDGNVEEFVRHVWAFDQLRVTLEDRHRTAMYRQEADRARFQRQSPTIGEFLEELELRIEISTLAMGQVDRVAQLTHRTNQFNFTTVRRNDGEIRRLADSGLECRAVEVKDRFGNYGLVGVMIFGGRGIALEVDTFLLSCRVLGRGVEHRMLCELGEIALRRQLSILSATVIPTQKNQPARDFLQGVAASYGFPVDGGWRYEIPAEIAATIAYNPGSIAHARGLLSEREGYVRSNSGTTAICRDAGRLERIAMELGSPRQVLDAMRHRSGRRRARPELGSPLISPTTEVEAELARLWAELLELESVGIADDYFDLGGTSLLAVDLFARIEHRFGKRLPLSSLIEASTIERLAHLVAGSTNQDSLVLLRAGESQRPALFLVHDGDGETMLYRSLAMNLKPGYPVYGLQPYSRPDAPMAHTRITEMAAYYLGKIRSIQSQGPYLLGGMCAGGVIAFEIAHQLQGMGEQVGLLALFDAADAKARLKTWHFFSRRLQNFSSEVLHGQATRLDSRVLSVLGKALRKLRNLCKYLIEYQAETLRDRIRMRLLRSYLDRGQRLPRLLRHVPVRTVYLFAEKDYRPMGLFDGEILLFRATSGEGRDEAYIERYEDPVLGWGYRATRGVRAYDVPGGHSSMLQEPHVQILAAQLQVSVDEVFAAKPSLECESTVMDSSRQASQPVSTIY